MTGPDAEGPLILLIKRASGDEEVSAAGLDRACCCANQAAGKKPLLVKR